MTREAFLSRHSLFIISESLFLVLSFKETKILPNSTRKREKEYGDVSVTITPTRWTV